MQAGAFVRVLPGTLVPALSPFSMRFVDHYFNQGPPMRPFETLVLLANLLAFLPLMSPLPSAGRWAQRLAPGAPLAAVAQVVAEGWRWQLVPAYALGALAFMIWVTRRISPVPSGVDVPYYPRLATK